MSGPCETSARELHKFRIVFGGKKKEKAEGKIFPFTNLWRVRGASFQRRRRGEAVEEPQRRQPQRRQPLRAPVLWSFSHNSFGQPNAPHITVGHHQDVSGKEFGICMWQSSTEENIMETCNHGTIVHHFFEQTSVVGSGASTSVFSCAWETGMVSPPWPAYPCRPFPQWPYTPSRVSFLHLI